MGRGEGGGRQRERERENTGNRDGESEAIWKVISSLNAGYLFINERKVFFKLRKKKKTCLC